MEWNFKLRNGYRSKVNVGSNLAGAIGWGGHSYEASDLQLLKSGEASHGIMAYFLHCNLMFNDSRWIWNIWAKETSPHQVVLALAALVVVAPPLTLQKNRPSNLPSQRVGAPLLRRCSLCRRFVFLPFSCVFFSPQRKMEAMFNRRYRLSLRHLQYLIPYGTRLFSNENTFRTLAHLAHCGKGCLRNAAAMVSRAKSPKAD